MKMKGLRWWVVGLIAFAAIINYIDRTSLNILWKDIFAELYPDMEYQGHRQLYTYVSIAFMLSYAFGQAIFGKIFDWIGTRLAFAWSIGIWSLATIMHAFAKGVVSFGIFRSILGVAEAGNWPGAAKGNAEWFPTKERAFAQGLFNSGAAIGGMIAFPIISFMSIYFDWQWIFIIIGILGFLWLIPWLYLVKSPPKDHPWISEEERNYILSGQKNQDLDGDGNFDDGYNPSIGALLNHKESWGVILASAAIDPIWWLFVFWIPGYLMEVYGMDVKSVGIYAWVPYVGAMIGAWFGGLLAQNRLKAGWDVNRTRKSVIILGCVIMLPALLALANPGNPINAVLVMAVILFGFQTAIGNIQTLPSDFFSGKTVGTLSGIAGMAAKLMGAFLLYFIPELTKSGNYFPAFVIGAGLALMVMISVLLLCPKIEPLKPEN
ncbi:MAG: MFS transporter [Bacteroidota bacterium]